MKKSLLLLSLMVSLGINSQIVNIPDTNFKAKLLSSSPSNTVAKDLNGNYFAIDANGDGEIQVGEASSVSELNVSNTNIVTLWGIAEFGHITSLNASGTLITSYDNYDSYNLYFLWNLKKLNLKNCINLQTFSHQINNGQTSTILEELNLENCSSLQSIEVSNGNLSYLNIKNCFNLTALWAEKNKLNFIESSNNLNLKKIFLYHNYFNSFNIEAPSLQKLDLFSNNLINFNIYNYPQLEDLNIGGNRIANLDVSGHSKINTLLSWNDDPIIRPFQNPAIYLKNVNANNCTNLDLIVLNSSLLQNVFIKNGKIDNLNIIDSPNLQFICCDANEVATIQNNFPNVTVTSDCNIGPVLGTVENSSNPATIKVHPNPTKGDVTITADSKIKSVEIYDAQGRIIQKQMGINSQEAKVSIHSSTSGMYIFKITTEKEVISKKVIKN